MILNDERNIYSLIQVLILFPYTVRYFGNKSMGKKKLGH